jgi:ketosteroid isomerase-like protein
MATAEMTLLELTASVARLADIQAITDRLYAYCHAIDHGDSEGWLDCFTDDGSWVVEATDGHLVYDVHGQANLRAWILDAHLHNPEDYYHMTINPRILKLEGDEAVASSYYMTSRFADDGLVMRGTGRYSDVLRRCADGQWRIKDRRINRAFAYV